MDGVKRQQKRKSEERQKAGSLELINRAKTVKNTMIHKGDSGKGQQDERDIGRTHGRGEEDSNGRTLAHRKKGLHT